MTADMAFLGRPDTVGLALVTATARMLGVNRIGHAGVCFMVHEIGTIVLLPLACLAVLTLSLGLPGSAGDVRGPGPAWHADAMILRRVSRPASPSGP